MGINSPLVTPTKTSNQKSSRQQPPVQESQAKAMEPQSTEFFRTRFEAYNRLQGAAVAFGEKLPIPEIVALGGQSDGKSSLLEALLGFKFNVREVEMGTRRPLILQMVHEPSALEPRCRFQEEDSDDYGSPIVLSSAIAEVIKSRTDSHLKKTRTAVSPKPIVMRAEYAHCPNLTIIDTPGFVLKAKKGEPDNTPDEILSMVKALAAPPHRLLLFLQQSSVEWCSSLWLDVVRSVDPTLRRTIVVVSKFDNRLKEFTDRWEVDRYLSASGYLGDSTRPFFVALPKDRGVTSNEEFRRQISQVGSDIVHHLRESVKGGFDEENGMDDQENRPPKANAPLTNTPGKSSDKEVLRESQMTIPETPSPDQPGEPVGAGKKRDHGNHAEPGMRKLHMRIMPSNTTSLDPTNKTGTCLVVQTTMLQEQVQHTLKFAALLLSILPESEKSLLSEACRQF